MKILLIGDHPYKKDFIDFFQGKHELIESKEDLLENRNARIELRDQNFDWIINFYGLNEIEYVSQIMSDIRLMNFDLSLSNSKIIHLFNASHSLLTNSDYLTLSKKISKDCIILEVFNLYTTDLKDNSYINDLILNSNKEYQGKAITSYNVLNLFLNGIIEGKSIDSYKMRICDYYVDKTQIKSLFSNCSLKEIKSYYDGDRVLLSSYNLNKDKYIEVLKNHIDKNLIRSSTSNENFYNEYLGQLIFEPKLERPIGAKFALFFDGRDIY